MEEKNTFKKELEKFLNETFPDGELPKSIKLPEELINKLKKVKQSHTKHIADDELCADPYHREKKKLIPFERKIKRLADSNREASYYIFGKLIYKKGYLVED